MNNIDIEHLYEEMYAPKLLPTDLLENLKADNYIEVNFHTENELIIGTTKCKLPSGDIGLFKYTFLKNKLIQIQQINKHESHIIYNRSNEISLIKEQLIKQLKVKAI